MAATLSLDGKVRVKSPALDGALLGIYSNNGQQCLAGSRIFVERGIAARLPEQESWRAAFGLTVTIIWIYIEMLRLLAILRGSDRLNRNMPGGHASSSSSQVTKPSLRKRAS